MDRAELANRLHDQGMSCAQSVAGVFDDVIGLEREKVFALTGTFGGGFRAGEICGVVSGAAMVLGAAYPHTDPADKAAKELASERIQEFHRRFCRRFDVLDCRRLKEMPPRPEKSPAAQRLGLERSCPVYIAAAVELVEEMLREDGKL